MKNPKLTTADLHRAEVALRLRAEAIEDQITVGFYRDVKVAKAAAKLWRLTRNKILIMISLRQNIRYNRANK